MKAAAFPRTQAARFHHDGIAYSVDRCEEGKFTDSGRDQFRDDALKALEPVIADRP